MFIDRAIGIDLGTTNSAVALLDPSERDLVVWADRFGRRLVPSAVAWDPKAEAFLVGRAARARRGRGPSPIESIKRSMGQDLRVQCGPVTLSPEEVSAKILAELRALMLAHLADNVPAGVLPRVDRAVITVPAYFDAPQVEATRRAGELAGLDPIGLLQEPTAAAIYQTWKQKLGDGNFLVYDFGGGTFDVSVLRCIGGEHQVLASVGDNYLGGDDLDRRFAEHLRVRLSEQGYALDLDVSGDAGDRERFQRLVHLAQEIKESLSTTDVLSVSKQDYLEDKRGEPVSFEGEIGRAEWETVVADLVETTIECCDRALARSAEVAGVGREGIDHVVLVGGTSRVPLVVRRVTEAVCGPSRASMPLADEVDTCVALGAAIHAARIGGLRIGDDGERAIVQVRSPLVAPGPSIRVDLDIERAPEGSATLAATQDERPLGAATVGPERGGPSVRLDIPFCGDGAQTVDLTFRDIAGASLATLPLSVWRDVPRPRASSLSQPSVITKDIAIEILRGGRRARRVLLERGTGLPAERSHRFFTGDRSGAVVLRLLQDRLPIKTLVLEVGPLLEVGTAVDLTISCDEAMRLEARAEVAGNRLWVRIDGPPKEAPPTVEAALALIRVAEEVGRELWGHEAQAFRREADRLTAGVREVLHTDPAKLSALVARLTHLVDELRTRDDHALSPPLHRFEMRMDELRRVVYSHREGLLGLTRDAWDTRLARLDDDGRAAWDAGDAVAWRRAYDEVCALSDTTAQEEIAALRTNTPAYLRQWLRGLTHWAGKLEVAIDDFVPSAAQEVADLQRAERERLAVWLRDRALGALSTLDADESEAAAVRRTLETVQSDLRRIEDAIDRLPGIGLVTDRG